MHPGIQDVCKEHYKINKNFLNKNLDNKKKYNEGFKPSFMYNFTHQKKKLLMKRLLKIWTNYSFSNNLQFLSFQTT